MDKPKNDFLTLGESEWKEERGKMLSIELGESKVKSKQAYLITKGY
jgi:hypothetical protein